MDPTPSPEPATGVALRTPQPQKAPESVVSPIAASVFPTDPMSATAPITQIKGSPPKPDAALPKICSTCESRYPLDFLVCPRDATPLTVEGQAGVDPLVGKILGEAYQILRPVGEGGMGGVYAAKHLPLKDPPFRAKVLPP